MTTVITLFRYQFNEHTTIGNLILPNGKRFYTLEDKVRSFGKNGEGKIWGKTAIPSGKYQIVVNYSVRFKKPMPLLLNVPYFEGIRIHSGTTEANTAGCLLLGIDVYNGQLLQSRTAFDIFFKWLQVELTKAKVYIEIVNGESLPL